MIVTAIRYATILHGPPFVQGDSGGPLILSGLQVGIVSHGGISDCGSAAAYTRTASHVAWIKNPDSTPTPTPTPGKAFIRRILLALLALFSQ